ncbi:MAG TPA: hypothetical protein VGN34_32055 [Ktedonobacteraceae bacterium]
MKPKRKNAREASGAVVVVSSTSVARTGEHQRRMIVGVRLSLQARRESLQHMVPQYRTASSAQKRELLDTFTQITGYHRKYAMWLLNHMDQASVYPHRRQYGAEV